MAQNAVFTEIGFGGNSGGLTKPYDKPDPFLQVPILAGVEGYKQINEKGGRSIFIKGYRNAKDGGFFDGTTVDSYSIYFGRGWWINEHTSIDRKGKNKFLLWKLSLAYGIEEARWRESGSIFRGTDAYKLIQAGFGLSTIKEHQRVLTGWSVTIRKDFVLSAEREGWFHEKGKSRGALALEISWRMGVPILRKYHQKATNIK